MNYSIYTHNHPRSDWAQPLLGQVAERFTEGPTRDGAHDLAHALRVAGLAHRLAREEGADAEVCWVAGLMHDLVYLPKNHPDSSRSGELGAEEARRWCLRMPALAERADRIAEAIGTHSFSAGLAPTSLEGAVLQDADRLEAIGAIGIARCFATGGSMGIGLWHPEDPWALARVPNDKAWSLDHFGLKLLRLAERMNTASARRLAAPRQALLRSFLEALREELNP